MQAALLPFGALVALLSINCNFNSNQSVQVQEEDIHDHNLIEDTLSLQLHLHPKSNYALSRKSLQQVRENYRQKLIASPDSMKPNITHAAGEALVEALLNEIFPHWYGTPWDFNGHTDVPNQGEIACGYFVSTTLKHAGFQLNRFRMAQQSAKSEVRTLQLNNQYIALWNKDRDYFMTEANKLDEGLYILGLSNHVGYLLKRKGKVIFIHSNYVDGNVMAEYANQSLCIEYSSAFVIGSISNNDALILKWLNGEEIAVVMD